MKTKKDLENYLNECTSLHKNGQDVPSYIVFEESIESTNQFAEILSQIIGEKIDENDVVKQYTNVVGIDYMPYLGNGQIIDHIPYTIHNSVINYTYNHSLGYFKAKENSPCLYFYSPLYLDNKNIKHERQAIKITGLSFCIALLIIIGIAYFHYH